MAKNINQKKRVARIKSGLDDDIKGRCRDYVSSIIEEMDSNFKTVQSNKLYSSKLPVISNENANENIKDTCLPSTSKSSTQVNKTFKSKTFGMSRKYPLMEKSQKILKHIKHNQSIPKQRAHLASLPKSPIKKSIACNNSIVSIPKKINQKQNVIRIKRNKNAAFSKTFDNTDNICIINKNTRLSVSECMSEVCKKVAKGEVKKNSYSENDCNNNKNIISDNKGDTTDSEYERFLQNNKKKSKKQKSLSKTKSIRKSSKKAHKSTVNKRITKLNDYHSDDDTPVNQHKKRKRLKKDTNLKKRQYIAHFSDSESDVINDETFTRDTSSDSDIVGTESITEKNCIESEFVEQTKKESCLTSQSHPLHAETYVRDTCSEYLLHNILNDKDITKGNNLPVLVDSFKNTTPDSSLGTSNVVSDNVYKSAISYDLPSLPEKNNCTAQHNEEELEIEIVDIVMPKSKATTVRRDEVTTNFKEIKIHEITSLCTKEQRNSQIHLKVKDGQKVQNDFDEGKKNEATYITDICKEFNQETDSKVNILKECKFNDLLLNNISNTPKETISHDVIKQNMALKKEDSDEDIVIVDCILNKKPDVKMEISGTVNCSINNSDIKNETCFKSSNAVCKMDPSKSENVTLKDLKLSEVACSNLTYTIPCEIAQKLTPLMQPKNPMEERIDVKELLDLFKKEFQIYQEIIQTEANVEKSLKTIESYQAEKLKNIRSLIQKVVEGKHCLSEDNDPKVHEHTNLLCKSEEINKLPITENKIFPECSSKDNQDFKNSYLQEMHTINIAENFLPKYSITTVASLPSQSNLLPSIAVNRDVKPNLSLLHNIPRSVFAHQSAVTPKLETTSVQELPNASTIKLLGEKCNVCGKEAVAACQRCAKVFFCSNECGKKYWIGGHKNECGE